MRGILFSTIFLLFSISIHAQCWQKIYTGNAGKHSMAIKNDGSLFGWGENVNGQVGDNSTTNRNLPMAVGSHTDWKVLTPNGSHTLGIRTNGELWAWGHNGNGELGNGTNTNSQVPIQIGSSTDWDTISAGAGFSHGIKNDGTLWAWGYGGYNQLGVGGGANLNSPTQVNSSTNWKSVSGGVFSAVAMKSDGSIWQWGNGYYQGAPSGIPVQIGADMDWKMVVHGAEHNLAIKNNGTLWVWGNNLTGQLGDGTSGGTHTGLPKQIGTDNNWALVSAGGAASFGIKTDGTLWAWGNNSYGQLGDGSNTDKYVPTQIGTATDWVDVAAGSYHTFARKSDGTLWATGWNDQGQLGLGITFNTNSFTQISCSGATPVTWLRFDARAIEKSINLVWQTASEQNSAYFEVERSDAPERFIKIGSIPAAGTSSTIITYTFTDNAPLNGNNFYRIKQVDANGQFNYSFIKVTNFTGKRNQAVIVYPVPASTKLQVAITKEMEGKNIRISIRNNEGKLVQQIQKNPGNGAQSITLDVSSLISGLYHITVVSGNEQLSSQFIKK